MMAPPRQEAKAQITNVSEISINMAGKITPMRQKKME